MSTLTKNDVKRFLQSFTIGSESECWVWNKSKHKGYGTLFVKRKMLVASRFSWIVFRGKIPVGMHVLHNCPEKDNPACVNPNHLWLGTARDNMRDKYDKWHSKGMSPNKKSRNCSPEQVMEIRRLSVETDMTHKQIGELFSVTKHYIGEILRGEIWDWLK